MVQYLTLSIPAPKNLSHALYPNISGRLLDIHSTASTDEAMLIPYLPRNTARKTLGFDDFALGPDMSKDRTYLATQKVVSTTVKNLLEGTSNDSMANELALDIASLYHKSDSNLEGTAIDMCKHINGMPVKHVLADFYHGVLGSSFNSVMLHPMIEGLKLDGVPTVLETGGPNLSSCHHHVAIDCARAYTHNTLGWPNHIPSLPKSHKRYYYTNSESVTRPSKNNTENATHQNESYLLLHDAKCIPDSVKAKTDIDWNTIKPGRLNSYKKIKEGDAIAIGEESGNVIRAPHDGFIAITPGSKIDAEYSASTAVAAIAKTRIDERDIAASTNQGRG